MKIVKEFRFEMAHVLSNYNGPCGNLHGHSYRCLMEFKSPSLGQAGEEGMVIDFNKVKDLVGDAIINRMDHAFAYNSNTTDPFERKLAAVCEEFGKKTIPFPHRTTAELMSEWIYAKTNELLAAAGLKYKVICNRVTLYETVTGAAIGGD